MISLCFLNLFLAVLGLRECMGFSQVATSGGYSRVAGHGLFRVGASLFVEHRLRQLCLPATEHPLTSYTQA